jgi:hypothetical protein
MPRKTSVIPGSAEDRSPAGFCLRHGNMSNSTYHRNKKAGRGPKETVLSARKIIITRKDEAAYDRARSNPNSTEQRLLQKLQAKRTAQAKKAAAASLAGKNHVSKRHKRVG